MTSFTVGTPLPLEVMTAAQSGDVGAGHVGSVFLNESRHPISGTPMPLICSMVADGTAGGATGVALQCNLGLGWFIVGTLSIAAVPALQTFSKGSFTAPMSPYGVRFRTIMQGSPTGGTAVIVTLASTVLLKLEV